MPEFTMILGRRGLQELDRALLEYAMSNYPEHVCCFQQAVERTNEPELDLHPVGQELEDNGVVIKKGKKGWEVIEEDCPFL